MHFALSVYAELPSGYISAAFESSPQKSLIVCTSTVFISDLLSSVAMCCFFYMRVSLNEHNGG